MPPNSKFFERVECLLSGSTVEVRSGELWAKDMG
jgi:hypothetical protein